MASNLFFRRYLFNKSSSAFMKLRFRLGFQRSAAAVHIPNRYATQHHAESRPLIDDRFQYLRDRGQYRFASERISLTSTLNDSGMPASILCSPSRWIRKLCAALGVIRFYGEHSCNV